MRVVGRVGPRGADNRGCSNPYLCLLRCIPEQLSLLSAESSCRPTPPTTKHSHSLLSTLHPPLHTRPPPPSPP